MVSLASVMGPELWAPVFYGGLLLCSNRFIRIPNQEPILRDPRIYFRLTPRTLGIPRGRPTSQGALEFGLREGSRIGVLFLLDFSRALGS